mgnify:CR=1 FL=1
MTLLHGVNGPRGVCLSAIHSSDFNNYCRQNKHCAYNFDYTSKEASELKLTNLVLFHYSDIVARHVADISPTLSQRINNRIWLDAVPLAKMSATCRRHVAGMLATFFKNQNFDFQRHCCAAKIFVAKNQ